MRKFIAALVILCISSLPSFAEDTAFNEDVPERYVVQRGDTLWDIAAMFLSDPWRWQDIWHVNTQIENPHLIYPGDVIALVFIDGEQRLTTISRGEDARTIRVTPDDMEGGLVRLQPSVRVTPILGAIPAIPREYVDGFLSGNRIVSQEMLRRAPYIISGDEGRLIMGAGDTVFARGNFEDEDRAYQIYRQGQVLTDPNTRENLGFEAIELGQARLTAYQNEIATLRLQRSNQEIALRDRILPSDEALLDSIFYPSEPPEGVTGEILRVARGVRSIGQFDVVIINRGEREGLIPGNIFRVLVAGNIVRDPETNQNVRLPDTPAGLMMVFRTFDKVSYGLILESERPMSVGDQIRSPGF